MTPFAAAVDGALGADRLRSSIALAPFTTFRVGGAAEWLLETRSSDELVTALKLARDFGVPVTLLGGGSNVLVSDRGVRGLVIRPRGGDVRAVGEGGVRADAAVTINGLVRWTINHGRAGLEAWAGTPGTVGGAIFGNAHFAGRLIGELVTGVRIVSRQRNCARPHAPRSRSASGRNRSIARVPAASFRIPSLAATEFRKGSRGRPVPSSIAPV